ncbi:hypothetical protein NHQ30_006994 [Ciborinia camelliae]|nr:hypothetical protein NHQ30_006994 [Ciborinia camelliae]
MIQKGYDRSKGTPYEIFAPDNRYVFVSSAEHIKEIDAAPDSVLSLQAAAKQVQPAISEIHIGYITKNMQMLQPKYTMHNFNWFDRRGTEGMPLVKTLRTLLTNNVPEILPNIRMAVSELFDEVHGTAPIMNGKDFTRRKGSEYTILSVFERCQGLLLILDGDSGRCLLQCSGILWYRAR